MWLVLSTKRSHKAVIFKICFRPQNDPFLSMGYLRLHKNSQTPPHTNYEKIFLAQPLHSRLRGYLSRIFFTSLWSHKTGQIHVSIDTITLSTTKASEHVHRKNCQNLHKFPLQSALFWKLLGLIRNLTNCTTDHTTPLPSSTVQRQDPPPSMAFSRSWVES